MAKRPVVYWERSGKTEQYETIKYCAVALHTSTSHVKRLLETGKIFLRDRDLCTLDEL
ncbi:MAG: hypothetical protein HQ557_14380 [Bacteroidetes bacterium]|nr:hypothetical protein [Bacteroidota bacterium]